MLDTPKAHYDWFTQCPTMNNLMNLDMKVRK